MGEEPIAVVRRIWEAFGANDPEPGLALLADDVEWTPAADEPEAVQGLFLQWLTAFDDFRSEPLEFIEVGDLVVVPLKFSGKMRGSGVEVGFDETQVYRVSDGLVREVWEYRTKDEAMEAVSA
jgi:ketosteroid isomerase-like protein